MKPKILLVCCNGLENGGIQAIIMSIVENLHMEYDFNAIVFSEGRQHHTDKFLKYGNIHTFKRFKGNNILSKIFEDVINYILYSIQINKFLKRDNNYIAIHCHNYFEAAPFLKIARKYGIKNRIAHSHNVAPPYKRKNPIYNFIEKIYKKMIHKYATDRVACSVAAGAYLFDVDKVRVINNAIDLSRFNSNNYCNNQCSNLRFVHVGRYSFQKNQLFLLDVFKELLLYDSKIHLYLVGHGYLKKQVEIKIKELKMENNITMLPHDIDIPEVFANSDAMIFPSTYEGLGISLIEAQAMGVRCYVSEAIQPEANLGLCHILQLDSGAKKWAEYIYKDIVCNGIYKHYIDMSSYDICNIIEDYRKLYEIREEGVIQ